MSTELSAQCVLCACNLLASLAFVVELLHIVKEACLLQTFLPVRHPYT